MFHANCAEGFAYIVLKGFPICLCDVKVCSSFSYASKDQKTLAKYP